MFLIETSLFSHGVCRSDKIWGRHQVVIGLLPRVGRRRCTPADRPLARITRADTRPLPCRSGNAPEGKLNPYSCHPLLPGHRTHHRRAPGSRRGAVSRARCRATTTDRTPASPLPRSLPDGGEWRGPAGPGQAQAHSGTQHSKRGSPAGARGRVLSRRARSHFTVVARCCYHPPR